MGNPGKKIPKQTEDPCIQDQSDAASDETASAITPDDNFQDVIFISGDEKSRMKAVMDAIGDPISIQDTSYRILYQNEAHKKMIGNHSGEVCFRAYNNRDSICEMCPIAMTFKDGLTHTVEKAGAEDKGITAVEITASPLLDSRGTIIAGIEVVRNLTARRKAEEALRHAEAKFRSLVEHSLVGIYIFQDGTFQYMNPKAAAIFGYSSEQVKSLRLNDLFEGEALKTVEENIESLLCDNTASTHSCLKSRKSDGTEIEIESQETKTEINDRPAVIGTILDITGRRKMEEEMQKVHKIESLSSFAGGIAHEYNNILTAIIGNLALAKMYAKPGYEVYDVLNEAEKASLRAKDLTYQLLSFAKGGVPAKKVVFLKDLLKDLADLFREPNGSSCEISAPDGLWPVEIDEVQIGQALTALLMHAQQATLRGGSMRVTAENRLVGQASSLPIKDGRYVIISIEDQSGGLPGHKLQTLFDPFIPGDLTYGNLGLASSFTIVQKHNGHITAESHAGKGTVFRVYLPATHERPDIAAEAPSPSSGRRRRILVMDDEEIVRVVINRLLQQCGFEAELSRDGAEMLRIYREAKTEGRPFDLVILDLIIQDGMGGQEAVRHLLSYDQNARVIVSSGYSNDPIMARYRDYGFSGFLPKPYRLDELKRILREVFTGV